MAEFIKGFGVLIGYFALCALSALAVKHYLSPPREVFRKILHFILLGSIFIFTYLMDSWWMAAIQVLAFVVVVYPALVAAETIPGYSELLIERKKGEIKGSLIAVFVMFFVLICVCWGWLGQKYLVIASVIAWGFGDAAAALVGKRFGKNYIQGRMVEGRKSLEGTLAMFVAAFFSVLAVLAINVSMSWSGYLLIACITAAVSAFVELFTKNGMDTLTCPFSAAFTMILLLPSLGGVHLV